MDQIEYLRLKRQIDEEYARNLDALRTVWRISNQLPDAAAPPPPDDVGLNGSRQRQGKGEITKAVHGVLKSTTGAFSWRTVQQRMVDLRPDIMPNRTTISQALRKLIEEGMVEEISPKRGTIAAQYRIVMGTTEQLNQLKTFVKACGFSADEFRARFMAPRGCEKVSETPKHIVAEIIDEIQGLWGGTLAEAEEAVRDLSRRE